ncbi:MAG: hypothetical protein QW112_02860, partial [Candidatus Micrarchaeia archaeon]
MIEVKTEPRTAGHQDKGKKLKQLLLCSFIVAAPLVTTVYKFVSEQRKLVQQETAIFKHRREIIKRYEGLSATELRARITSPKEAGEFIE